MVFGEVIENLAKMSEKNARIISEDYQKDGLWYCGKCHTPKQHRIHAMGTERVVFCMCECQANEFDEERKSVAEKDRKDRISRLRENAFPDGEMTECCFANDIVQNQKISDACKSYVEQFEHFKSSGKGLMLHGDGGVGKTYYACCIANALIDKGIPVLVRSFTALSIMAKSSDANKRDIVTGLKDFDLLVLDDLGAEVLTEYTSEILFGIVNSRIVANLPIIITTNIGIKDFKETANPLNKRTFSRILEKCLPIEVTGKNRRYENIRNEYADDMKRLGIDVE